VQSIALGPLDWTICAIYLIAVVGLGLWFSRKQDDNDDYFVGGRKMHWFPIGLSIFAGTFSSLSFVGLPRDGAYEDYHLLLGILFIPLVVMPIVGWWFVPLFHRLKVTSCYEYLELRFHRGIRLCASILFMFYTTLWMGNMLLAVGKILQVVLSLNDTQMKIAIATVGLLATIYTTLGGVKAVVWTDALQAFGLGGGMLLVLILALGKIDGGLAETIRVGAANDKFQMFRMDITSEANVFGACAFGFFVYLAGHAVNFTAVQRYVSMPSVREARRSLLVNGIMVTLTCSLFFFVGSTLFVYYDQMANPDTPTPFQVLHDREQGDQLLPYFVMNELPQIGLTGMLVAGLFAAAMSSMDSGINSLTASIVCDWRRGDQQSVSQSRKWCVLFGLLAITSSIVISLVTKAPVFKILMTIAGTFLGLLLGIFLLGMLVARANWQGAMMGLVGGIFIWGVCKYLGMTYWWDGACTTISTFAIGTLFSLSFPPPDTSLLKKRLG
jgi:SSS family solute:Na+ symporter